ncbi:hypothetical protein [Lonsdalea populi]|uniref:Uncharacterized protein n=1 Tax=Lonsdalea populi TaxID=1172565 RepID=A0A3N0UA28_9GAMM|nr:hypothetical protein [Lonsdalea populi]ROH77419.1 hypothetical protein EC393_11290 [Lonsdalea populi]ROH79241.1 hypothetical protein EC392_11505 [Lonsdalea populi]
MKEIIIRSSISIFLLGLSYAASLAVTAFSMPQLLVVGFIISQCLNECVSYSKINNKDKQISRLKQRLSFHHTSLENISDSENIPKEEKVAIKSVKQDIFETITYDFSEKEGGKESEDKKPKSAQAAKNSFGRKNQIRYKKQFIPK